MARPAGAQLSRWFGYMVVLLLSVNVSAVTGSFLIQRSVTEIADRYQPFAVATSTIQRDILTAQRHLFEYLAEFSDSPAEALASLAGLRADLAAARAVAPTPEAAAALEEMEGLAGRYRLALEQLPSAREGATRDWSRLRELGGAAVRLGGEVDTRAAQLAEGARTEIRAKNATTSAVATGALVVYVLVMLASVGVILSLRHWWKRFQDTILGI